MMKLSTIKKMLSVAMALTLTASLAACGSSSSGGSTSTESASTATEAASTESATSTEAASEEVAEEAAAETATDDLTPIDNYPAKSLQITMPPAAGGGTDTLVRAMAPAMEEYLGVPVTVVNKSGGGCAIGYAAGAQDPNDGSCITACVAELLGLPYTTDFEYTYHDFDIICNFNNCYGTICVPKDAPYDTIEDFIQYMKDNPGTRFANSGIGGPWHILAAAFADSLGVEVVHVPCDGGGPAATACAGGNVEAVNVSDAEVKTYVDSDLLKMLLTFSPTRLKEYPDVPTSDEKGLEGSAIVVFRGFCGPKGMPEQAKLDIANATRYALQDPAVIEFMDNNMYTRDFMDAASYTEMLDNMDAIIAEQCEKLGLSK